MSAPLNDYEIRKLLFSLPGKAIRILCDRYYGGLVEIALSLTHDDAAAKDIVQEAFFHVWRNSRRLGKQHERSIEHYLVRIVRNRAMSYYNKSLFNERKIHAVRVEESEQSAESHIIQFEIAREIADMIARFPPRERQCLTLKMDEELTNPEISARLGVGIKAVERSLTSARKRLRRELQTRLNKKY